ncbi:hypothetical protein K458DRAFT_491244 [Lentithecium fluviatile CBS 122367]|uniref:Mid2 domain-containing protein n=1 Tax=Lentithecium fluviatile CBS 122367 TaxID=1168545 RepID=A0A6G1IJV0_9PLEO|nr:hypothetical protein K458DRAFT_491244 [Lentithecium fluviatile CBS 122367]
MTSLPTTYLPLTTTFTGPAECSGTPWMYQGVPTTWWKQGGDNVPSCFPPAFPFSNSRIIYSPGICPAGWSSACTRVITTDGRIQSVVSCCPRSFECASTKTPEHDWEDQFGCASPYSVNAAAWGISPSNDIVSSMYQLHVMVVDATTTSTPSATPSPSTSTPGTTRTPPSSTTPTATPTTSSAPPAVTPNNDQLTKGAIAGISIGAVVGVALLALFAYIAWKVRGKHRAEGAEPRQMVHYPEYPASPRYEAPYFNSAPGELDGAARHELKAS